MKKLFVLTLVLLMLLSLTACGEPEATGNQQPSTTQSSATQPSSTQPDTTQPTQTPVAMKTIYAITHQSVTQLHGEEVVVTRETAYVYDDAGNITNVIMSYDGLTQEYAVESDEYGRLHTMKSNQEGHEYVFVYTYDEAGRILSLTMSQDGQLTQTFSYTYDDQGRRTSYHILISDMLDQRIEYVYEQDRLAKELLYSDGVLRQYELYYYNDQGRIYKSETCLENDVVYSTWDYTYSEDGLTTTKTCERYKLSTVTVRDGHGNILRIENIDVGGSTVTEYTYIAIEIPEDTPRQNDYV